jgi:hypothetical protein
MLVKEAYRLELKITEEGYDFGAHDTLNHWRYCSRLRLAEHLPQRLLALGNRAYGLGPHRACAARTRPPSMNFWICSLPLRGHAELMRH